MEGKFVGRLLGFQFILNPHAPAPQANTVRFAALQTLTPELACRTAALILARDEEFSLHNGHYIYWRRSVVAYLEKGVTPLHPAFKLFAAAHLPASSRARIEDRVQSWLAQCIEGVLSPLVSLQRAVNKVNGTAEETLGSDARNIGVRLVENFGTLARTQIATELKNLDQDERAKLRKQGVRFGEHTLFMPHLLKPVPAGMLALLWALWAQQQKNISIPPAAGRTSVPLNKDLPHAYYYACGYRPSGMRAVRVDMIERLAEQIRKARQAADMREGFAATSGMMSLVGCSGEEFDAILTSMGLRKNTVTKMIPAMPADTPAQGDTPAAAPAALDAPITGAAQPDQSPHKEDTAPATPASDAPLEADAALPVQENQEDTSKTDPPAQQEVTLVLWKSAPRTTPARHKNTPASTAKRNTKPTKGKRQDTPSQHTRRDGRKHKQHTDKGMRTFTASPKTSSKRHDKDSPFAVLATLKNDD